MNCLAYCRLAALAVALTLCGSGIPDARADDTSTPRDIPPADPLLHLELHVYGFSRHTDREGVRRAHLDNEFNFGAGLSYEFHNDELGVGFVSGGIYQDSGRHWAKLAGPGYQFKLGDYLRFGAVLPVIQSKTYNDGRVFVAPLPLLTADLGLVKLNAMYAPKYRENHFAVFGFFFSVPIGP
jgi:hypothetical protein